MVTFMFTFMFAECVCMYGVCVCVWCMCAYGVCLIFL